MRRRRLRKPTAFAPKNHFQDIDTHRSVHISDCSISALKMAGMRQMTFQ
jgi:hypothetical protein